MIDALARLLTRRSYVFARLSQRQADFNRYLWLAAATFDRDVRICPDYQRKFNGLYMVRRNAAWRQSFYDLLEREKRNPELRFSSILEQIFVATGRIEASFASKLVATARPEKPVYDSFVRTNLGLPVRRGPTAKRCSDLIDDYSQIEMWFGQIIGEQPYHGLAVEFDARFPQLSLLSDVKKLDFMLWQLDR